MENNIKYETIHRFLLDELDANERAAFETELASNEDVKKQVELEKKFLKMISDVSDADLRNTISSVHMDLKSKKFFDTQQKGEAKIVQLKDRNSLKYLYAIAAVIAVLIASWYVFIKGDDANIDTNELYANYYSPENKLADYYITQGFQGSTNSAEEKLRIALDQYNHMEYGQFSWNFER